MTDTDRALDVIARAAADLVPQLTERLARHGLGEIEVSDGDLRLRVVAAAAGNPATPAAPPGAAEPANPGVEPAAAAPSALGVASPAVGFFVYADGLGPGLSVAKGDALGHVEMLGVRHDVRAPRGGTVRNLVAESGEAVEYGQIVVELEPAEATR
ncbi:MAG: acetyl-CoA carboxylase, biotin carboxyl carrier protein [Chloroflexota bacterium]|nr:acetyl-CoA carboxylase, biotin carboxyl carrier protein [Chloroflexota bacterium]